MSKNAKQPVWRTLLTGTGIALVIHLTAQLLLAELVIQNTLPEEMLFAVQTVIAGLAALAGGLYCVGRTPWGSLGGAMAETILFAGILLLAGFLIYEGSLTLLGRGGILLAAILAGGVLAGILGNRRRKKKRRLS